MKRREVLKRTMLTTGAVLSVPMYGTLLSGCRPKISAENAYTPKAFSQMQFVKLEVIADTLLPSTDTPSASEAGVTRVIDDLTGEVFTAAVREEFLAQFEKLTGYLEDHGFRTASEDQRILILQELESAEGDLRQFWLQLKGQIVHLYLTSETVAENQLNYLPVPGAYEPCIQLSETNGKAWAI